MQFRTEQDHADMLEEVKLMARVRGHPNVIEMFEWLEDRKGFWIVMEVANGGELMARIVALHTFSEADASRLFRQMCEAVKFCHDKGVVVRGACPLRGSGDNGSGGRGHEPICRERGPTHHRLRASTRAVFDLDHR